MESAVIIPQTQRQLDEQKASEIRASFTDEFLSKYYRDDPTFRLVFHGLMAGRGPYSIIEILIEDRKKLLDQLRHIHMYHASPRGMQHYPECDNKDICPFQFK